MEFRNISGISDKDMAECFNEAFSDYAVPIRLDERSLRYFFESGGVDPTLSYCAFSDGRIIGFILNSSNVYNGEKVVFDCGTGVVPEHRGKGVFTSLYAYAEKELCKRGIEKYYLEVLQQNERAISLYKRNGFSVVREYSVLQLDKKEKTSDSGDVRTLPLSEFEFGLTEGCTVVTPSYEQSDNVIRACPEFYETAFVETDGKLSAFCIFGKHDGRLIQLGYRNISDLEKTVKHIASKYDVIHAKNIDLSFKEVMDMLTSMGFKEVVRQYEMAKRLTAKTDN